MTSTSRFVVDKHVNITFLFGLALQTAAMLTGAAWYSAKVDARIAALEITDARLISERDVRRKAVDDKMDLLYKDRDRLVRIETQMDGVTRILTRIEAKVERMDERVSK